MGLREQCVGYGENTGFLFPEYRYLYERLIEESFRDPAGPAGKPCITLFGSPVIYSLKYTKADHTGIRLTAEPGGRCADVPERINHCLELLKSTAADLSWNIAGDLNEILPILYPEDLSQIREWLGGMWIGLDTAGSQPLLKLYMNLRHQSLVTRWQKIADVVVRYSSPELEADMRYIIACTQTLGNPIGIGVGLGKDGLKGVRIYLSFAEPDQAVWKNIYERFAPEGLNRVSRLIEAYSQWFAGSAQAVMTFDYAVGGDGLLMPCPVRLKTELSACGLKGEKQQRFERFMSSQMEELGFHSKAMEADILHAKQQFDAVFYQYVSLGTGTCVLGGADREHFTVYFEPVAGSQTN